VPVRGVGPVCGALAGGLGGFLLADLAPIEIASAWVPFAVAGALLTRTRLRAVPVIAAALVASVWAVVAWTPVASPVTRGLTRRDGLRPADAVVVMASRLQADGDPTQEAYARLSRGMELLTRKLAVRLIAPRPEPGGATGALVREWLGRWRLDAEVLTVGPVSRTRDEAVAVAALCRERGWRTVIVVTSPLHSGRASAALEREGLEVISAPADEARFDLETLDRPPERLAAFSEALYERVATWVYARRGWIRGG